MGKPFAKEIAENIATYHWAVNQDINDLRDEILHSTLPLYIVGSGGSLSACHFAAYLYQQHGLMAKAVTPLELAYSKNTLKNCNVLFISASGKNTDILFSYKVAIESGVNRTYCLCMKKDSPLSELAKKDSVSSVYEFDNPSGKDGFLATNSLVGFFGILNKSLNVTTISQEILPVDETFELELKNFLVKVSPEFTFTVLYAGWAHPVAIDLESKLAEAALADVLLSDYRNFGHGRHHWFDKRKNTSAIIALVTPKERALAEKTLSLLPRDIPILIVRTELDEPSASIDLLIKSFKIINQLGIKQNIDPGRPGVPEFGSKLYKLNYQKMFTRKEDIKTFRMKRAIEHKANVHSFEVLDVSERDYWTNAYNDFVNKLSSTTFGSIIFDYDGTICSAQNRLTGPDASTFKHLVSLLNSGIIIGIATGRGQSVRTDLQRALPQKFWDQVVIGYYNCSDIGLLSNNQLPDKTIAADSQLNYIFTQLGKFQFSVPIVPELKPHQITIEITDKHNWKKVRPAIIQFIIGLNLSHIQILESSHSMDIIDQRHSNKLNIVNECANRAKQNNLSEQCLSIGDKGRWPGNDYQLLSSEFSLSVDEVSMLPNSCWNFSPNGLKNIETTIYYLSCLQHSDGGLTFKLT